MSTQTFLQKSLCFSTIIVTAHLLAFLPNILFYSAEGLFGEILDPNSYSYDLLDLAATGIAIALLYGAYHKQDPDVIPFEKEGAVKTYGLGFLSGGLIFLVIWGMALLSGLYRTEWTFKGDHLLPLLGLLVGYGIQGMSEEVIFHGFMQAKLTKLFSAGWSNILTALAFAAMHLANAGMTAIAFADLVLSALIMGLIRQRTNSLWFIGAYHAAWNFFQGPLLGVNVSGNSASILVFRSVNQSPLAWLSGGEFGLEASLITILVDLFLLIGVYYALPAKRTRSRSHSLASGG